MERYIIYFHTTSNKHINIVNLIIYFNELFIQNKSKYKFILDLIKQPCIPITKVSSSTKSIQCLRFLSNILKIEIQHSCHIGEYKIKAYNKTWFVDGFHNCSLHKCNKKTCLFNNVIFEFQGNYYHGNRYLYDSTDKCFGIPYSLIWKRDKFKQNCLENKEYKVIYIWETFFDDLLKVLLKI